MPSESVSRVKLACCRAWSSLLCCSSHSESVHSIRRRSPPTRQEACKKTRTSGLVMRCHISLTLECSCAMARARQPLRCSPSASVVFPAPHGPTMPIRGLIFSGSSEVLMVVMQIWFSGPAFPELPGVPLVRLEHFRSDAFWTRGRGAVGLYRTTPFSFGAADGRTLFFPGYVDWQADSHAAYIVPPPFQHF